MQEFDFKIIPFEPKFKTPLAQIFDLDGTLAKRKDRGIFDFDKVGQDVCIPHIQRLFRKIGENSVNIIVTGRPDSCRDKTYEWLLRNDILLRDPFFLFMRKTGDFRPGPQVKYEIFDAHLRGFDIQFVVDNHTPTCEMWRQVGLTVLHVSRMPHFTPPEENDH